MKNNETESSNFIKFGTFNAGEAERLKSELEKRGIPVKVTYPGTNIGRESTGGAAWTAYELSIPANTRKKATEIYQGLNIEPKYKFSVPKFLYTKTKTARYVFIASFIIVLFFAITIIRREGIRDIKDFLISGVSNIILITISVFGFLVIIIGGIKAIKANKSLGKKK